MTELISYSNSFSESKHTIILTGSTKGVGKILGKNLSSKYNIVSINRMYDEDISEHASQIIFDLSKIDTHEAKIRKSINSLKNIYGLINNAAILTSFPLIGMPSNKVIEQYKVNLIAPTILMKIVCKKMIRQKFGRIINMGSMATKVNAPGDTVYGASKSGLNKISQILNVELGGTGITVNTLSLSATQTGMLQQITGDDSRKILKYIPSKKLADSADILNAINFFLDEKSSDVSGQNIFLGGVC